MRIDDDDDDVDGIRDDDRDDDDDDVVRCGIQHAPIERLVDGDGGEGGVIEGGGAGDDGAGKGETPRPNVHRSRQPPNWLSSFGGGEGGEEDGVCVGVGGGDGDGDGVGDERDGYEWLYWTGLTTSSSSSYFDIKRRMHRQ
jgi:hypothetical protein